VSWTSGYKDNAARLAQAVTASGSTLMRTPASGAVLAARLLARTGHAGRFATAAAFADYTGTAPLEIASAHKARHRLSRTGDRQLNSVLHTIAVVWIRMPHTPGRAYYMRKLAEGKTAREAKRCLRRRLADHVWRIMIADERRRDRQRTLGTGPGGHSGATVQSGAASLTPATGSSDESLPEPATTHPTTSPYPT
jgi:hypothetical protein